MYACSVLLFVCECILNMWLAQGEFSYKHTLLPQIIYLFIYLIVLRACVVISLAIKILLPIFRPTSTSQKTDGELPAEYVSSSLAQQSQVWYSVVHMLYSNFSLSFSAHYNPNMKRSQNMHIIMFGLLEPDYELWSEII